MVCMCVWGRGVQNVYQRADGRHDVVGREGLLLLAQQPLLLLDDWRGCHANPATSEPRVEAVAAVDPVLVGTLWRTAARI